jgi:SAM-dependent methyltransferase
MDLNDTKLNWELFGKLDPLRAILHTKPGEGEWELEAFFKTGEQEVAGQMEHLSRLGVEVQRGSCLDFGCGVGRLTQALCAHFSHSTGIDIAESMIERAKRLNQHPGGCNYVVNDKPNLECFEDESFDMVLSIIVLQHINPRYSKRYIREFMRVLRPGGVAVFQVPTSRSAGAEDSRLGEGAYRAAIEVKTSLASMPAGTRSPVTVVVQNTGDSTWPAPSGIRLGNHWRSDQRLIRDDARTELGRDVSPGERVELELWVTAPAISERYVLEFDLVHEGVTWFEQCGSAVAAIPVDVTVGPVSPSVNGDDSAPPLPVMEMHCIPESEVRRLLGAAGGEVIDASPYEVAGGDFASVRYVARRTRPAERTVVRSDRRVVITASKPLDSGGVIRRQGLDRPARGTLKTTTLLDIAGWIDWTGEPPAWIEVVHGDRVLRESPLDTPRPDVRNAYPDVSNAAEPGYRALVGLAGLPREFEVMLRAAYPDGRKVPFRSIRGRHCALLPRRQPSLLPLMVTGLGRAGTTWIMRLLSLHPEVAVHTQYPHELRLARYWFHALNVLSQPANERQSLHMDNAASNAWLVGSNPALGDYLRQDPAMFRWLERDYVDKLADFFCRSAEEMYLEMTVERDADVRYFAEKYLPGHLQNTVWSLYPQAREIILVRDPRDVLASMLAFNLKRGYASFGREDCATDREFVEHLRVQFGALVSASHEREEHVHVLRYEDLVGSPVTALESLARYLGVDDDPDLLRGIISDAEASSVELAGHRTTSDAGASVHRWQRDLSPELQELSTELFAESLAAFGYPV